jgi:diamine N-acetyltransferase
LDQQTGEIESVFVRERYRAMGVGSTLVASALAWLDEHGSVRNRVSVADGNEDVFAFYRKFHFYRRMTVLEQKRD